MAKKLLILDNDEGIVELAAWFLERKGYSVRTAPSFREAVQRMAEDWPDLLLSDIDLGEESGAEELPRLSREGRLPATLVVSGYLDVELAERLRQLPEVRGTIVKPFDLAVLEERIRLALEEGEPVPPAAALPRDVPRTLGSTNSIAHPDEEGWIEIRPFDPSSGPDGGGR